MYQQGDLEYYRNYWKYSSPLSAGAAAGKYRNKYSCPLLNDFMYMEVETSEEEDIEKMPKDQQHAGNWKVNRSKYRKLH